MKGWVAIKKWVLLIIIVSFIPVFSLGLIVGTNMNRKFEAGKESLHAEITDALLGMKAKRVGNFFIVPDKNSTLKHPVSYIYPLKVIWSVSGTARNGGYILAPNEGRVCPVCHAPNKPTIKGKTGMVIAGAGFQGRSRTWEGK